MVGVNLADMLRSLYWIPCKTKRWYQKTFWHLIHMAKINAWLLYRPHFHWNEKTHKDQKSMLQFSLDLSEALIFANKVNPSSSKERSPERWSSEAPTTGKKPTQTLPVTCVCSGQVAHLPSATTNKNRCRLCSMTCRMQCFSYKTFLCSLADRNCFIDFYTKP